MSEESYGQDENRWSGVKQSQTGPPEGINESVRGTIRQTKSQSLFSVIFPQGFKVRHGVIAICVVVVAWLCDLYWGEFGDQTYWKDGTEYPVTGSFWYWVFGLVLWLGGLLTPPIGMLAAYSTKADQNLKYLTEEGVPNRETKEGRLLHEDSISSFRYSLIWMASWFLYFLLYGWWT